MLAKITRIIGIGFAIFWMIFTFLEYWQYHEEVRRALDFFQYYELASFLILIGALLVFLFHRFRREKWFSFVTTGGGLSILFLLLGVGCMNGFFYENLGSFLSLSEDFTLIGTLLGVGLAIYLIVLVAYASGRTLYLYLAPTVKMAGADLIFIAIGILLIVTLLFILGIFGGLFGFILWPLMLFTLFLSWRSAWHFIQLSLLKPIALFRELNIVGLSVLYLLSLFVVMNFIQAARPYPTGFDAMTHYVNISSLIGDYHRLVLGHGAYNWSLFMSLGLLLYGKLSVTLSLSFLGSVLSLFALYKVSRIWLSPHYSLLVLFLFYTIPMISWLSYRDMKVDMGLLFYSLVIVMLMVDWLQPALAAEHSVEPARSRKKRKGKDDSPSSFRKRLETYIPAIIRENPHLSLISILAGFAMGIKFSALILILALVPTIAYAKGNRVIFAAITTMMLSFLLIARLDDQAALRSLHLWADQLQWVLLLVGLGLSIYLFLNQKKVFLKILRLSMLCAILSGICLSPWLVKNIIETRSFSVSSITSGKSANPHPSVLEIKRIYENKQHGK